MDTPAPNDDGLPSELSQIAARAALEGIPVAAIARVLAHPVSQVYATLNLHQACGTITEVPRPDWPPTARNGDRVPTVNMKTDPMDLMFVAQRNFKLTKLEAGFLATLLRCDHADKSMLHGVIEQQRLQRAQQPDSMETTDPKMVDVMICKLRKKLVGINIAWDKAVTTVWSGGYFIAPPFKAAIMSRLKDGDSSGGQSQH